MKLRCRNCSYSVVPRITIPNRCPYCGDTQLLKEDILIVNKELAHVQ
ncbi:TPA: hypothetical protein HA249_03240 [Candidatus Woesearchaeota archaeon]|nr:hypothetical protein [Candidatus Woesearchaeota archaeon]HIH47170.1 hypothetical protein [Candidatus Woesearchaeota archaeon]HII88868.1 hypothetical protein [Candidatus Woesearchaeota archaeon]